MCENFNVGLGRLKMQLAAQMCIQMDLLFAGFHC